MQRTRSTVLVASELFAPGGIQYVGRQALIAIAQASGSDELAVWTLRDAAVPAGFDAGAARISCAGGTRARLVTWAARAAAGPCRGVAVIVMHLHLVPLAIPLQMRGASMAVMLYGVEAWRRLNSVHRMALLRAERIVAISEYTADRFRDANPVFRGRRIAICHPGIVDVSQPAATVDDRTVLMVSRLSSEDRYKGHDALIAAWTQVRLAVPDATLVIVGDGDDRPRLERLAAEHRVADKVRFLGHLPEDELAAWYGRCGFFALPSTGEGFGLVFLEAMRVGKACVACPGAPAEIVEDGGTGLIVPNQRPDVLATAIVRLYTDRALRARLGRNGYQRWRSRFTSDHFAARFRACMFGGPSEPAA